MAIRKIARMGNPILREKARPVPEGQILSEPIQRLIGDMWETMTDHSGAGLAAPQVHESLQIVVFGFQRNPRYPDKEEIARMTLINPEIVFPDDEKEEDWEGCLSLPDLRGIVERNVRINVSTCNEKGERVAFSAEGFAARVIQHETDHLLGKLFIDRMTDMTKLMYLEEYGRYRQEQMNRALSKSREA